LKQWAFIIDVEKCEDCNNCFLACKDEHVGNEWKEYTHSQPLHGHRWINIFRKERGQYPLIDVAYLPVPCMHCDNAPCIKAAENNAVVKREDGIVMIDYAKAAGQKEILKACPYDAIWWNEEKNVPQKCTLCAHLIDDGWEKPRCVQACPTGALRVIKVDKEEMASFVKYGHLEILKPGLNTEPRVYYKNLFRYEKCFISGSVAFDNEGITDCAEGAEVSLFKDANRIAEMKTDNFGDFKFDKLEKNSGTYRIEIEYKDYGKKVMNIDLYASLSAGTIILDQA
jgi:Fe-S-cluster-containing dehydrogenase component